MFSSFFSIVVKQFWRSVLVEAKSALVEVNSSFVSSRLASTLARFGILDVFELRMWSKRRAWSSNDWLLEFAQRFIASTS